MPTLSCLNFGLSVSIPTRTLSPFPLGSTRLLKACQSFESNAVGAALIFVKYQVVDDVVLIVALLNMKPTRSTMTRASIAEAKRRQHVNTLL